MNIRLEKAVSLEDVLRCYPVIQELRTTLSEADFVRIYRDAHAANGYELLYLEEKLEENGRIIAILGYRILHDFVHGKHLYIDDLAVRADSRSRGLGSSMLRQAEELATELGCVGLRLCTGVENLGAKKFYEREGWLPRAWAFKKKLSKQG